MGADVGARRPGGPDTTDVDAGAGVRGVPWTRNAVLVDWMLGNGAQIVPAYSPALTLADTKTHEFYFRAVPRYQAFQRIWSFTLRTTATGSVTCGVAAPTGSTETSYGVAETQETSPVLTFVEDLSSQSDAEGNASIQFTPSGGDVILESLACVEVPRATLATTAAEDGVDTTKFGTSFPIRAEDHTNMVDVLNDETKIGRRCSLWQWAVPSNVNSALTAGFAWTTSSTGYQSMFPFGVPILTRKIAPADTTGSVKCKVLAWVNSGTTGSVYFTSSVNGNSDSATITATIPTWSGEMTLTVDCDDVDSTDGRQTAASPAWDYAGVYGKVGSIDPGNDIYISAVSIWEEGPTDWVPSDLASIQYWWRGEDITGGSPYSAWLDKQSSADMAPVTAADTGTLGGQAALDFVAASLEYSQWATSSALLKFMHDDTGGTVVVVVSIDTASRGAILNNNNDQTTRTGFYLEQDASNEFRFMASNSTVANIDATSTGSAAAVGDHYVICRYDSAQAPDFSMRVDGTEVATGTVSGTPSTGNADHSLTMGRRSSSASRYFDGQIAEVILCNTYLTGSDLTSLESYLATRYGI